jgi:two-component SAPR family response regulator
MQNDMYWGLEFGNDVYCDYYYAVGLIQLLKNPENRNEKDIQRLISIVSRGEMLPSLQVEWVDSFKADFANELIDLFMDISQQPDLNLSSKIRIELADAIFIYDSLKEEALKLKCSILVEMGKNGLAQNVFRAFQKEYLASFGVPYKYSFEQIIAKQG